MRKYIFLLFAFCTVHSFVKAQQSSSLIRYAGDTLRGSLEVKNLNHTAFYRGGEEVKSSAVEQSPTRQLQKKPSRTYRKEQSWLHPELFAAFGVTSLRFEGDHVPITINPDERVLEMFHWQAGLGLDFYIPVYGAFFDFRQEIAFDGYRQSPSTYTFEKNAAINQQNTHELEFVYMRFNSLAKFNFARRPKSVRPYLQAGLGLGIAIRKSAETSVIEYRETPKESGARKYSKPMLGETNALEPLLIGEFGTEIKFLTVGLRFIHGRGFSGNATTRTPRNAYLLKVGLNF